jgi:hypothetical protein
LVSCFNIYCQRIEWADSRDFPTPDAYLGLKGNAPPNSSSGFYFPFGRACESSVSRVLAILVHRSVRTSHQLLISEHVRHPGMPSMLSGNLIRWADLAYALILYTLYSIALGKIESLSPEDGER